MVAAGPLVNAATAGSLLAYPIHGTGNGEVLAELVAAYAAVVTLSNLLPMSAHVGGGNDGRQLMRLLRHAKSQETPRRQHARTVLEAGMTGEPTAALQMLDKAMADPTIATERKTVLVSMRPLYLAALYRYAEALDGFELLRTIRPLQQHELIWLLDATISADLTGQRAWVEDIGPRCIETAALLDRVAGPMKPGTHQWSAQRTRGLIAFQLEDYELAAQHAVGLLALRPAPGWVADARALIGLADARRGRTAAARQALADARLLYASSPWTAALERELQQFPATG